LKATIVSIGCMGYYATDLFIGKQHNCLEEATLAVDDAKIVLVVKYAQRTGI
jgi:hypothetical protein